MPSPDCQWISAFVLALAALLPACDRSAPPAPPAERPPAELFSGWVPLRREANDAGRFLAGLPGVAGSSFGGLERTEAWRIHRLELDRQWRGIQSEAIPAMTGFQSRELSGAPIGDPVVFYPFSGPDALFVRVLFPRSPTYVMVGLEPPGTLPAPDRLASRDLGRYLAAVRSSVYSELHRSFFITRQMDREFRGQLSDGLLPTILHLLARTGHTIDGYRYVQLNLEGRIAERVPGREAPPTPAGNRGVEIGFRADADQTAHKLFYFSSNLSDARLRKNEPFLRFLSNLRGMTTYLKATSYMPHHKEFSILRRQVLDGSTAILQDDSGIPYRFFDPAAWRVQLYGAYDRPYGSFRWLEQPDLRKAYATLAPKPLGFRIGYGFSRIPSNLLLAVRADGTGGLRTERSKTGFRRR